MLGGGAGVTLLAAVSAVHALALPVGQLDDVTRSIWLGQCALIVVIAVGVMVRMYMVRTAAARMARIEVDGGPAGPAVPITDRAVLRLSREQVVFAEIRYDSRLAGSADLVQASAASAALALEYLAAQARLRAELRDVAAVRARLVICGDAERRRLERNLHDGAQQRLIALGLMLGTASSALASVRPTDRADAVAAELATQHGEIDLVVQELRTVARGLFPTSLSEAGVQAPLRELGDHTTCPLLVTGSITGTVPLTVGMAV
jgi:signal transduction histidine kinase